MPVPPPGAGPVLRFLVMGVEFRQFLVVNDATWLPQSDTLSRVEAVLREWALVNQPPRLIDLSGGRPQFTTPDRLGSSPGAGLALAWPGIEGGAVERVAGPNQSGGGADERYIEQIVAVAGLDYRVQWSSEDYYFQLVKPPSEGGRLQARYPDPDFGRTRLSTAWADAFPCSAAASPPVVRIQIEDRARRQVGWRNLDGFWRAALVLEFGKDIPAFADAVHLLPERAFVAEVSAAFRGPIEEIGEFY